MAAPIQKLVWLCRSIFNNQSRGKISKECLCPLIRELNEIEAADLQFDSSEIEKREASLKDYERAPVSYMPLVDDSSFTMSVFILKEGSSLPLHDHPNMHGMLKVISGKIKVTSYTVMEPEPLPQNCENIQTRATRFSSGPPADLVKTVVKNEDIIISSDDECCVLSPSEGNIHEIHPLTNIAAFLDILAPPYADDCSCHYYREIASHSESSENRRWLLEIPQPRSYWCDTVRYKGPQLSVLDHLPGTT